jgi:tRNA pseudouridine55 synthase
MRYTLIVNEDNPIKESLQNKIELIDYNNFLIEKETYNHFTNLLNQYPNMKLLKAYEQEKNTIYGTGTALLIEIEDNIEESLTNNGFIINIQTGNLIEIRYVGLLPAKIMKEKHLTLEEYNNNYSCVFAVNKPFGVTSFDVVNEISHLFGISKVGHTGTLDPIATGVLLITVGQATKIVELLTANDKEYIAGVELGYETDTYDNTGTITKRKEVPNNIDIKDTLASFKKTYQQEVPIYSAIKVDGKKLYEYARRNKEVTLPKKEVTIKEIKLLEENKNTFKFKSLVTKGCYIRSLIRDIGLSLNTYATMTSLVRTKQGKVSIEETNTLEELQRGEAKLYTIEEVLDYPVIIVDKDLEFKIRNGQKINNIWKIIDRCIFKNEENKLLGIYERDNLMLKVWKNFR